MSNPRTICILCDERIHMRVCEVHRRRREILARGKVEYRVPDSLLVQYDPEELAGAVAESFGNTGADARRITLVLPLHWCFTHVLEVKRSKASAQTLSYDFEQYLPLPLEEVTCAFLPLVGDHVLAVAIPTQPMEKLIEVLAEKGVEVEHLTIDAVAAGELNENSKARPVRIIMDTRWCRVSVGSGDGRNGGAFAFGVSGSESLVDAINDQLERRSVDAAAEPGGWSVLNVANSSSSQSSIGSPEDGAETTSCLEMDDAVDTLALGAASSRLDLRTGALAAAGRWDTVSRLAHHCMLCLLVLAILWTAGLFHARRSLQDQLGRVDEARHKVYRQVFDTEDMPPGAAMRVASERIRLEGLTRKSDGSVQSAGTTGLATRSPLETLRRFVDALPDDVRIMLLDARIDCSQLTLHGQTARHRDAERITEAVGQVPDLTARPPRTSRLKSGGVEFSILATVDKQDGR